MKESIAPIEKPDANYRVQKESIISSNQSIYEPLSKNKAEFEDALDQDP